MARPYTPSPSDYQLNEAEELILNLLSKNLSMTAGEIIDELRIARSSVYQGIRNLENYELIRNATPGRKRNAKYVLGTKSDGPNTIIPSLRWGQEFYKSTFFLQADNSIPIEAFEQLITGLALTLQQVENLNNGRALEDVDVMLRRARARLIESRSTFNDLVSLVDQILSDKHFWNPIYLEKFSKDPAWRPQFIKDVLKPEDRDALDSP